MKFGKVLTAELPREWRSHAVDYKLLKRLIKPCAGLSRHQKLDAAAFAHRPSAPLRSPSMSTKDALRSSRAEIAFFWAMRGQLFKVNRMFVLSQFELVRCLGDCDDGLERLLWSSPMPSPGFVRYVIEAVLLPRLEKLYFQMKALEKFCDLNYQAVARILKKHDKWTGLRTRADYEEFMVEHEPFAAHLPLSMAIGYLEETSFWLTNVAAATPPSSSSFTSPHPPFKAAASRAGDDDEVVESITDRDGCSSPTDASSGLYDDFDEEEEEDEVTYRLPPLHFLLSPRRLQLLAVAACGLKRERGGDDDVPPPKRRRE